MTTVTLPPLHNGQPSSLGEIPSLNVDDFRQTILNEVSAGSRISALFGRPAGEAVELIAVLSRQDTGELTPLRSTIGDRYPALTPECPEAHWFEREIAEQWGVVPEGHPWLKPVRFHPSYRPGHDAWGRDSKEILPSVTNFYQVTGAQVH